MLKSVEFEILKLLMVNEETLYTQRNMAEFLGISLGKINYTIKNLVNMNLITYDESNYHITSKGQLALNEYKVDNAIIMAAGMSSRFAPISYEKPKGLLVVKGEVLIEREIKQLQAAGITNIIVVVGYMKEKYLYLEDKYNVSIIVNDDYYRYNNTSTLMKVLDKLANTYICSCDNYFVDNVFEPYVYRSYYSAVYSSDETNEYCLTFDSQDKITNVTIGGSNSWYMLGHVYFDKSFSTKFKRILEQEYDTPETKEHLWENLYIKHIKELPLYIRKYDTDQIFEFDSLEEIRAFDNEYINNADSRILRNICKVLNCEIKDITGIVAIKAGLTNTSFKFSICDRQYVYRHPGIGTEKYINRMGEAQSMKIAYKLGLDDTYIHIDEKEGWKISKYIEDARELDYHNLAQVNCAISMFKKLHSQNIMASYDFGLWNKTLNFISTLQNSGKTDFDGFNELYNLIASVNKIVEHDGYEKTCLCHNDCYSPNFLIDKDDKMYLIDWEYSGNDDPASDLGTFICCSDYSYEEALDVISIYDDIVQNNSKLLAHYMGYIAITSYYWYIWALFQEYRGNTVGEWLYIWYKNSKFYAKKTLEILSLC